MPPPRFPPQPGGRRLVDVIRDSGSGFGDLPVEYAVDLAAGVVLDRAVADAVARAITALLDNIALHAAATAVVVHADEGDDEWEITVCDDGRGFDAATTPAGFGLTIQVQQALAVRGVSSQVSSVPGEGTTAVLRGESHGP